MTEAGLAAAADLAPGAAARADDCGQAIEANAPPAFATGEAQELEELRAVPLRSRPRPSRLGAPLRSLKGVGPRLAAAAEGLGLHSLGDLLLHVPHTYRDRTELTEVGELRMGEEGTVLVEVKGARLRPTRRRNLTILEATVADASGPMKATWFNQAWLADKLVPGARLLLHGKLEKKGFRVDAHELLEADGEKARAPTGIHTTGIVPVHPASERLRPQRIREWAWQARRLAGDAIETLPAELRARRRLAGVGDALAAAHFPASWEDAETARGRLAFEELLLHQAALAHRRAERRDARAAIALDSPGALVAEWLAGLPFELTADQRRASEEIDADLGSSRPMQRLLMGEVGSGKTVVALFAMLRAVEGGHQAALMAPTETLAEQHFRTVETLLAGSGVSASLLTGSTPTGRRRDLLGHLSTGQLQLVVGTHALIEPQVSFARLAVAVVDEQHRFGVSQRAALDAKGPGGAAPHTLHMTATPIPRTLSMTAYGDLDATTLHELPAGRRPVRTWVVGEGKREGAYEFVRERLREGRQAYVVCPLVSESDKLQARAATEEGRRLAGGEFRDFALEVLHGQMPARAKQAVMERFVSGRTQVLVATSVIEVGIDVPNAAVMVVEEADRYGLSQLHQLRGRVGRGPHDSACILFADPRSEPARLRLEAISSSRDGFELAEVDLALRGEGEVLGTRQHGLPRFRVATLPEDAGMLVSARDEVVAMLRRHGSLEAPELGPLIDAARLRFGDERAEPIPA
jgi:ATP-dependent DNA helicase RecG